MAGILLRKKQQRFRKPETESAAPQRLPARFSFLISAFFRSTGRILALRSFMLRLLFSVFVCFNFFLYFSFCVFCGGDQACSYIFGVGIVHAFSVLIFRWSCCVVVLRIFVLGEYVVIFPPLFIHCSSAKQVDLNEFIRHMK